MAVGFMRSCWRIVFDKTDIAGTVLQTKRGFRHRIKKAQESIVLMEVYDLLAFVGAYGPVAVLHYQI